MRIREIMSEPVETVPPLLSIRDASNLMRTRGVHHLIVKEKGRVVGILSDVDLTKSREKHKSTDPVEQVMSLNIGLVDEQDTIRRAANLMRGRNVGCLAVTRSGALTGIVTVSDLLLLLGKGGERRAQGERAALHFRTPHRKQHGTRSW